MATYSLNEVLKARERENMGASGEKEMTLDDIARVKVLSPGRKVFKRFIRNRLAVFGSVVLITMFVFSFLGPLAYAYGQKEIFYKYDEQNINYAMAKENTAFNGYDVDESIEVERSVSNMMNSRIKTMIASDVESVAAIGDKGGSFVIDRLADDIYLLSEAELEPVAAVGKGSVRLGTYSGVTKEMKFAGAPVEGLEEALAKNAKGNSGSFSLDGVEYVYNKSEGKNYVVEAKFDGVYYLGEAKDKVFEKALNEAAETGAGFAYQGDEYVLCKIGTVYNAYRRGETAPAKVYTRLMVDTMTTGMQISQEMRVNALLAVGGQGGFTADGKNWTVADEDGLLIVRDAEGREFMELTPFSIRRYNGEDSMDYDLKKAVSEAVDDMIAAGQKTATITYVLPTQDENGEYSYDESGNLQYQDTELVITQQDTGEFVIRADQVIYVIDRYAAPSGKHVLGTDGDGFDVLARIMYGGRVSLMVGFVVVFLEIFLGIIMGGLAGYYGGWVDMVIMRLVDIFYCLPSMPIMIILGAMMDALRMDTYLRLMIMMAALGIMGWAGVARMVRGQILSLREQEFMVATEATGIKVKDRIFHHLVPNVMPQLIVIATMGMGGVILTESTLSFLGLGVKHPLATWGTMINSVSSASAMAHYAHIWIPVGLLICLTVIAFNFVGDGLRDAYDPKAKR